jgi:hypothetical protein
MQCAMQCRAVPCRACESEPSVQVRQSKVFTTPRFDIGNECMSGRVCKLPTDLPSE